MSFGALLGQSASGGGGKRVCRFTVGTSTAGWTANDCDYLCDGTNDQVEINSAIQALPTGGGEVVILDGTYNITATIAMNKDNVTLSGNGSSTVLKRMWNSTSEEGVITVTATNGGCEIERLCVDGNKASYGGSDNLGIYLYGSSNNRITGNIIRNATSSGVSCFSPQGVHPRPPPYNIVIENICFNNATGIGFTQGSNNIAASNACFSNSNSGIFTSGDRHVITGNVCNGNTSFGIRSLSSENLAIVGNTCNNNDVGVNFYMNVDASTVTGNTLCNNNTGVLLSQSDNNSIVGNTVIRGSGKSSDYTSSQYTIYLQRRYNNYNLVAYNNIMGKNYMSGGGTGNTFEGNKYN